MNLESKKKLVKISKHYLKLNGHSLTPFIVFETLQTPTKELLKNRGDSYEFQNPQVFDSFTQLIHVVPVDDFEFVLCLSFDKKQFQEYEFLTCDNERVKTEKYIYYFLDKIEYYDNNNFRIHNDQFEPEIANSSDFLNFRIKQLHLYKNLHSKLSDKTITRLNKEKAKRTVTINYEIVKSLKFTWDN